MAPSPRNNGSLNSSPSHRVLRTAKLLPLDPRMPIWRTRLCPIVLGSWRLIILILGEARRDVTGKRPMVVDLDGPTKMKRTRVPEQDKAIFVVEDDDEDEMDPVNITCPPKAVQFANT